MHRNLLLMAPIKKLMDKLTITRKFTALIVITVLGYIPATYYVYNDLHSSINAADNELQGVRYLSLVFDGLYTVVKSYGNASELDVSLVQKSLDAVNQLKDKKHDSFNIDDSIQAVTTALSKSLNRKDKVAAEAYIDGVAAAYKDLSKQIVSESKMAIDPGMDTYFLIVIVSDEMPSLLAEYSEFIGLQDQSTASSNALPSIQYQSSPERLILASRMNERIKALREDLKIVVAANAHLEAYSSNVNNKLDSISRSISESLKGNKDASSARMNQSALSTMEADGLSELSSLLEKNRADASRLFYLIMTATLLSLALILYVIMGVVDSVRESMAALTAQVKSIASGNLITQTKISSTDEFSILLGELSEMQSSLCSMVHQINDVSGTLNFSAHEIASGNNNLSERTQEQASCLVETSASLNNLTDTIRVNAGSAKDAAELSNNATMVAQKGGEAVNQVITTMGDINESAQKIQEITGVIDGIAFQTNLLALNASVEAARAGEQGRGFAVVASEVRNLAQRSAEAAKQIKALINDSMSKVASGDAQVKVTFATMQDIVDSIENVNSIIGQIAVASNEQSMSIEQINIVIAQLEGNTQKNAAQVEEVAASAELLKDQSSKLVSIVGEFQVTEASTSSHSKEVDKPAAVIKKSPSTNKAKAAPVKQATPAAKPSIPAAKPAASPIKSTPAKPASVGSAPQATKPVVDSDSSWTEF